MEFLRRQERDGRCGRGMQDVLVQGIPVDLGVEWLLKAAIEQSREDNLIIHRRKFYLAGVSLSDF